MSSEVRKALMRELVLEAKKREISGLAVYGEFDPETDERTLTSEALDEVIDAWNYIAVFFHKKYPHLRKQTENARALILSTYVALRELEREELKQTHRERGATG